MLVCVALFSLDLIVREDRKPQILKLPFHFFFVSTQEEETPLSAGLLSLHVHGKVALHGIINHEKDIVKNSPKQSTHLPRLSSDIL